jgi:hypothetical protein
VYRGGELRKNRFPKWDGHRLTSIDAHGMTTIAGKAEPNAASITAPCLYQGLEPQETTALPTHWSGTNSIPAFNHHDNSGSSSIDLSVISCLHIGLQALVVQERYKD